MIFISQTKEQQENMERDLGNLSLLTPDNCSHKRKKNSDLFMDAKVCLDCGLVLFKENKN